VLKIFFITFPFFALVLAGYIAARRKMLPLESIAGLNGFVLYFALPCMLYRFGASTPLAQLLDAPLFLTYLVCALTIVGFVVTFSLNSRIRWNDAAFGALVGAFPNTGFMGVPLLVALLGKAAAGPAILTMVVDMVVTSSLCIALSRLGGAALSAPLATRDVAVEISAARTATKQALKGVLSNPMPWAIFLGGLASAVQLALPQPVMQTVALLADAASPVALFTIGAVLARSKMMVRVGVTRPLGISTRADATHLATGAIKVMLLRDYLPVALTKLVVHPLLVLLVGSSAVRLGAEITPFALTVIVLVAALPSASNVVMLAERFGGDSGRIAQIILVSTILAFFTFSGAVAWLN